MSELKHIALSANGHDDVKRAEHYEEVFASRGVDVEWTLPPDISGNVGLPYAYDEKFLRDPAVFDHRRDVIQGAGALVVIVAFKEQVDNFGNAYGGQSGGFIVRHGTQPPGRESQVDMAMALGAEVPVFLPEGLPSLVDAQDRDNPFASSERLQGMRVLATPTVKLRFGTPQEHVDFIVETLQNAADAEATK